MLDLVDSSGGPLVPGVQLGSGGEGRVFEVANRPDVVAKIFHKPLSGEKFDKLNAMLTLSSASLASMTAWPSDIVLDKKRVPIGLLMPKVVGYKDIHKLYSPKSRKQEFPNADFRFILHVATNIARAFGAVHKAGVVIGDVNHGGITVAQNGTVKLIDCDSFQIRSKGHAYLCEVGIGTFTPPELQGHSFRGIVRTANHDNFGLAILLFHTLFMGKHPFAGTYLGRGDMQIETAIQQFRFVYGAGASKYEMRPPPFAPSLHSLSPDIAQLFEQAFSKSSAVAKGRPAAEDWISAFENLPKHVKACGASPAHLYSNTLNACPWCNFENASGIALFNIVLRPTTQGSSFDLQTVWRVIDAIRLGPLLPPPAETNFQAPHPAPEAVNAGRQQHSYKLRRYGKIPLAGTFVGIASILFPKGVFFWLFCGVFIYRMIGDGHNPAEVYETRFKSAESTYRLAQQRYANLSGAGSGPSARFHAKRKELESKRDVLSALSVQRAARIQKLDQERHQFQLERFLGNFFLEHASIPGIGAGRKATLESYNIETAADIDRYRILAVPGFGNAMTKKLVEWRKQKEKLFKFDPSIPIDPQQISLVDRELGKIRKGTEQVLSTGATELLQLKRQAELQIAQARQEVEMALQALVQARADMRAAWG